MKKILLFLSLLGCFGFSQNAECSAPEGAESGWLSGLYSSAAVGVAYGCRMGLETVKIASDRLLGDREKITGVVDVALKAGRESLRVLGDRERVAVVVDVAQDLLRRSVTRQAELVKKAHKLASDNPGKTLLVSGAAIAFALWKCSYPLHSAAYKGHLETVKLLLASGYGVNTYDEHGKTPLMRALLNGHFEVARLLIARGADVNSDLHRASYFRNVVLVRRLIEVGAEVNSIIYGRTPLYKAISIGSVQVAALLIEKGANVNERFYGKTLLHIAVLANSDQAVCLLLSNHADILALDSDDRTAAQIARYRGNECLARRIECWVSGPDGGEPEPTGVVAV